MTIPCFFTDRAQSRRDEMLVDRKRNTFTQSRRDGTIENGEWRMENDFQFSILNSQFPAGHCVADNTMYKLFIFYKSFLSLN